MPAKTQGTSTAPSKATTRVLNKAYTIQGKASKGAGASKMMAADSFNKLYGEYNLVVPPYRLERLLELRESNPIHGACIEQKTADIAGLGWTFKPTGGKKENEASKEQRERMEEFINECNPEMTFGEILSAVWDDYETTGWGIMEIVPDGKMGPAELWHGPAQTFRAHKDGKLFCQVRDEKYRWFRRYGDEQVYSLKDGKPAEGLAEGEQAGDLLVIRKMGSRSSFYGIPNWITSLGSILGSLSVRDYNIGFFADRTIPDMVLVIEGADIDSKVEQTLMNFFNIQGKAKGNKLCILPIPKFDDDEGEVKVKFEKLMSEVKDASFRLYRQDNALEICVAHRTPPYRIGWPIVGSLGGATAKEMTEIYKQSVIIPGQNILEHRINNFVLKRLFPETKLEWRWVLNEIDLTDKLKEMEYVTKGISYMVMTPRQGIAHMGIEGPEKDGEGDDPMLDKYYRPNSWATGEKQEQPPQLQQPGKQQPPNQEPKDEEDQVKKAADETLEEFRRIHKEREEATQPRVVNFFAARRRV